MGRRWSREHDAALLRLVQEPRDWSIHARVLERTVQEVQARWTKLAASRVKATTVSRNYVTHDKTKGQHLSEVHRQQIVEMYVAQEKVSYIAAFNKVALGTVHDVLRKASVALRSPRARASSALATVIAELQAATPSPATPALATN